MQSYKPEQDISNYHYLLHGDISGIQEFIFNVKSEGAAKTLKARSFFIHALAELAIDLIDDMLPDNCLLFYNGGGNFYIFCKNLISPDLNKIRTEIQAELVDKEIYLSLSATPLLPNFGLTWKNLHETANREKLRKFHMEIKAFEALNRKDEGEWKKFTKSLTVFNGYKLENYPLKSVVTEKEIGLFGKVLLLGNQSDNLQASIYNKLPEWDDELILTHEEYVDKLHQRNLKTDPDSKRTKPGDIIEFESMGQFAWKRTGTDKIGVLKMDVDNLGKLFLKSEKISQTKQISDSLKYFFENQLLELWQQTFTCLVGKNEEIHRFDKNVYIVFSGGDDCMMIGAWDAIFEFTKLTQSSFADYCKAQGQSQITLSASLTVLNSKYPVVRMSDLAEDALKAAKKEKPRISVFNNVLTWDEFNKASVTAKSLENLIKTKEESRSILNRIQISHIGFEKLQEKAILQNSISNPAVWRLFYFIRSSKNMQDIWEIIESYQRALIDALMTKRKFNAAAMAPVAARWAELLTRKKSNKDE